MQDRIINLAVGLFSTVVVLVSINLLLLLLLLLHLLTQKASIWSAFSFSNRCYGIKFIQKIIPLQL